MELIIEEISRGNKLIGRHKYQGDSLQIGRGYQNDLILSDPHVCAEHLQLRFDNEQQLWFVKDMQTLNGSINGSGKRMDVEQVLKSGDVIRVGKSQLRFLLPDHPVADSVKFSKMEHFVEFSAQWWVILTVITAFTLINALFAYLNTDIREISYSKVFTDALLTSLVVFIWPLVCAFIAFINKHEARLRNQIGVTFIIISLFWIADFSEAILGFNTSSAISVEWITAALGIAITFCLFWFNFYIALHQEPKRRLKFAGGLTALIYGAVLLIDAGNKPEFNPFPQYNSQIMTPGFLLVTGESSGQFVENSSELFTTARQAAKKKTQ
ncbi:FHA domain-containing protein [Thalassotalea mangrovi]|uniref:FHA domain-containing protein n=1 Tax=Thalassotalea mangrovi TaxID=2572245 RepID=A0A4U1B7Y1_9GAMM|nr:FHA domain-containing protein [Thalassotalea mangrovi]TKB46743.1 FHA domain-containing protein [Thalassotalea mangrovi]